MYQNNPDKLLLDQLLQGKVIANHTLGNPLAQALKLHVEDVSLDKIKLSFDISQQFTQGHGVVQGGIIAAMLDFAAAFLGLANTQDPKSVVTTNLSINYLRAAPAGKFYVDAHLDKTGAKMVFCSAALYQQTGSNIATAIFSMAVV